MNTITAIHSLRPNTEWTLENDDVENMVWHTPNVEPLTKVEVEAEIERLKKEEEQKKIEAVVKRQNALAKLAALGLEPDDLKALGL